MVKRSNISIGYKWLPIDSAPKNGTPIDLWGIWKMRGKATLSRIMDVHWGEGNWSKRQTWRTEEGWAIDDCFTPTHWRSINGPDVLNLEK